MADVLQCKQFKTGQCKQSPFILNDNILQDTCYMLHASRRGASDSVIDSSILSNPVDS